MNSISIVISAPSGAGKTTIIKKLMEEDRRFVFSVSTTTRPRREGEVEGISYYFVTEEEFRRMVERDEFVEWAMVHENRYGTAKKEIDRIQSLGKIPIFDVDVQGTRTLKGTISGGVYIFIIPPSIAELERRLTCRGTDSGGQIKIRMKNALSEFSEYGLFDYTVINDDINEAVVKIRAIITAEQSRTGRLTQRINAMLGE